MRFLSFLLLLPLMGCNSLWMVNIGSAAHEAASLGPALAPEVQCAEIGRAHV